MTDDADKADKYQQMQLSIAMKNRAARKSNENPTFNDNGMRICNDCGIIIPLKRIDLINAVTCVHCQSIRDKKDRIYL